ncbi:hypothetical protein BASA83_012234 [Batrachochytrium salamandrivorans]|nr:hypothetical protein BASA83_012234 [Batrachochytrium salamandrivorans]
MLDKLTVCNDVMDFLLTLFLLACSLNEVPGRNDAVQNVFTFSQAFETRLQRTPNALKLAALSQVGSRPAVFFLKFELLSDDKKKKMKQRPCIAEQILADNETDICLVAALTDLSGKRINHFSHILGCSFGIVALFTSRNRFQEKR